MSLQISTRIGGSHFLRWFRLLTRQMCEPGGRPAHCRSTLNYLALFQSGRRDLPHSPVAENHTRSARGAGSAPANSARLLTPNRRNNRVRFPSTAFTET